jgi:hypothetical protein
LKASVNCPNKSASSLAVKAHLLNLQHLQNEFVRTVGKYSGCTPARELLTAFQA